MEQNELKPQDQLEVAVNIRAYAEVKELKHLPKEADQLDSKALSKFVTELTNRMQDFDWDYIISRDMSLYLKGTKDKDTIFKDLEKLIRQQSGGPELALKIWKQFSPANEIFSPPTSIKYYQIYGRIIREQLRNPCTGIHWDRVPDLNKVQLHLERTMADGDHLFAIRAMQFRSLPNKIKTFKSYQSAEKFGFFKYVNHDVHVIQHTDTALHEIRDVNRRLQQGNVHTIPADFSTTLVQLNAIDGKVQKFTPPDEIAQMNDGERTLFIAKLTETMKSGFWRTDLGETLSIYKKGMGQFDQVNKDLLFLSLQDSGGMDEAVRIWNTHGPKSVMVAPDFIQAQQEFSARWIDRLGYETTGLNWQFLPKLSNVEKTLQEAETIGQLYFAIRSASHKSLPAELKTFSTASETLQYAFGRLQRKDFHHIGNVTAALKEVRSIMDNRLKQQMKRTRREQKSGKNLNQKSKGTAKKKGRRL